ncbi:radical SAM family heme chaperone HemW [Calidifontibacillus erzurumensis]|uniref:radical SAM family heme chaperone HemW n=1 Tax=Calidifontibacillus erzurumensis TaxID=2741433 RepID=UPI0035B50463
MARSVYLHIPFCESICHYCDFNKFYINRQPVYDYLIALEKEIEHTIAKYPPEAIKTVFVGGGTPTALPLRELDFLFNIIHKHLGAYFNEEIEFTFEANPSPLSKEKILLLKDGGVNRLSFGVQTFDDELLKIIGRSHRSIDAVRSICLAQETGFQNINVDLIYSLPGQTTYQFKDTIEKAFTLGVQHFSGYSLQIEPKTVFYNLMRKGKLQLPTEDEEAMMYEILIDEMKKNGYEQYEISNFALPGYESKHNLTYWCNEEYYGIGAGAHSYVDGVRRVNAGPLNQYVTLINKNGFPYIEEHIVTIQEKMEEEMFLGLRKTAGVSVDLFIQKFDKNIYEIFGEEINMLVKKGLLEETDGSVKLTKNGMFLGNEVFQTFIK